MVLLDTNVVIYSKQAHSEYHQQVTERLVQLVEQGTELTVCGQVLYEFYRFATSPAEENRGLGLTPEEAMIEIDNIMESYSLLQDNPDIDRWKQVMMEYQVRGKKSHDARLVATMISHGINRLYTLNTVDFVRFNNRIELI